MIAITCRDPKKGDVVYTIEPMIFNPEMVKLFWEKSSKFRTLFNTEVRDDINKFLGLFVGQDSAGVLYGKGLFYKISTADDPLVGVFYITDLELPIQVTVHFSFFDGRIRGREPLAKLMIRFVFETFNLHRMNCSIPVYVAEASIRFIQEIGFIFEGRRAKSVLFDGKYFDENLYGLLRSDIEVNGVEKAPHIRPFCSACKQVIDPHKKAARYGI